MKDQIADELHLSAEKASAEAPSAHMGNEPTEDERAALEEQEQQQAYDYTHELRAAWWGKPHYTEEELDDWLATRL